jgi:hypothetical protein
VGVLGGDEPGDLTRARFVVGLCERFHCLPDAGGLLDQDAELLRMLRIIELAGDTDPGGGEGGHG